MTGSPPPTRRTALALLALPWLAGCVANDPARPRSTDRADPPATTPAPATTGPSPDDSPAALPAVAPYVVLPGEMLPDCKQTAADVLTAALTWQQPAGGAQAPTRLRSVGGAAGVASGLAPLIEDHDASTVQISYPQYGGLSNNLRSASVMVVATQVFRARGNDTVTSRQFIVDLRLERTTSRWRATKAILGEPPAQASEPAPGAAQILANSKLVLPDPARADVAAGLIDNRVLSMLEALSTRWELSVQVLKSGHPRNVFETGRPSNHTLGRAVDIWAIDGTPVINQQRSAWAAVMGEAARLGANEIGGPKDLDKKRGKRPYFTNMVHQDHLHLGFDVIAPRPT